MLILITAGLIFLIACDDTRRRTDADENQIDTTQAYDQRSDDPDYERDRLGANRGQDIYREDRGRNGNTDSDINSNLTPDRKNREYTSTTLPEDVLEIFENDEAFKNLELKSSRSYIHEGKTYYEITLEETGDATNRRNTNNP